MVIATGLASLLMMLLATTWATFGRPALDVEARARIEQEGILATQSLACDFGGFLPDVPKSSGAMSDGVQRPYPYQAAGSPPWNVSNPGVLMLNFYGASTSEVVTVTYQLEGNQLVRTSTSTGVQTTVARYVTGFTPAPVQDQPNQVSITITIGYGNFTSTFTLVGVSPS
jgi:hypothetical protein